MLVQLNKLDKLVEQLQEQESGYLGELLRLMVRVYVRCIEYGFMQNFLLGGENIQCAQNYFLGPPTFTKIMSFKKKRWWKDQK